MSAPPETDREYAYFRAIGTGDPHIVSDHIGIEPDDIWTRGDPFERMGRNFTRNFSQWTLNSGLSDQSSLNDHLSSLIRRLEPFRDGLLHVQARFKTQFVCVGTYYQNFNWEMDFDHQKRATALGVGFWFDTYSLGDVHEEMSELRRIAATKK